jgi:hypothetical protein
MAYTNKASWFTPVYDLNGTGTGDVGIFAPGFRCKVLAIGFVCSSELIDAGASPVVVGDKIIDGTRGAANGGSLTIPASTAVGQTIVDTVTPYVLDANDALALQCTTAAAATGIGVFFVHYEIIEDTVANDSNVTESA